MNATIQKSLTKNQKMVLEKLQSASEPLSAYTLLDQLRDNGFRAPLQVYRALEKLIEQGRAHRLESLNAFVACCHGSCPDHDQAAFAICEKCSNVSEVDAGKALAQLGMLAKKDGFRMHRTVIEIRGLCHNCQSVKN